ncbi:hypothetical protein Lser_V15G14392 [Lactuca serriola]
MGFYMGFKEMGLSKYVLYVFSLLCYIQNIVLFLFPFIGVSDHEVESHHPHHKKPSKSLLLSAVLTREVLVVTNFKNIQKKDLPTSCAVCLNEFTGDDKIRCLKNCTHIFHDCCLDCWMNESKDTCPVCRTPMLPFECEDEYKNRLRVATDHHDWYDEALVIQELL